MDGELTESIAAAMNTNNATAFHEPEHDHAAPDDTPHARVIPAPGTVPNPGSPEAVGRGCTCARIDNHHGRGSRYGDGVFIMSGACPLHGTKAPGTVPSEAEIAADDQKTGDRFE